MRFFKRKRAVYHLNTKDKQTPMEGGINDQLEDSPSKMTTRLKSVGAFLRGCINVAAGCFHGIRPTQKTEDSMDVYGIYRRCSSYGRLAPVSETECELRIESPPKYDFEIETPPESDIKIETPPGSDIEIETPPGSDIETFPSTREIVPTILDNFRFHRFLGAGSFGNVVLASHISNDELLALKIITKDDFYVNEILNESRILQEVRTSPFCTHVYGAFKTKDKVVFAMEYLSGGDLMDFIKERAPLDIATIRFLTAEIFCGLRFLHNRGIVHRDLKPDNIMLDSVGHVRIADFGLSAIGVGSDNALDDSVGTPMFRAPEIYLELSYGYAADYFSLGVIVYMMATGYYPFMGLDANMLACSILNERPPFPEDFNMDLKDLIGNILLCEWQDMRAMLCENLRSHPFFMDVDWKELEVGEVSPPFTMKTCPPVDLTTEIKLEEIIPPPKEQRETKSTEEDQELYCGFSFTNSRWKEVQRPQMSSALPAEEPPIIKSQQ